MECPEELLCAADFTLVSELVNNHKEKVEAWKEALESRKIRVDDKNMKTMITSGNVCKFTDEGKFLCAVFRKGVCNNFILFQFGGVRDVVVSVVK